MMRRRRSGAGEASTFLTLTSLVDLFTNLVLFLIYNFSSEGQAVPAADQLKLPESVSEITPQATITVMITQVDILIEGKRVAAIGQVMKTDELLIPELKKELDFEAKKAKYLASLGSKKEFGGHVTILGDKSIPFRLLEKVMYTCSQSEFGQIDLGVIRKETA